MDKTAFLIWEICDWCNLASKHPACPVNEPSRHIGGRPITDELIVIKSIMLAREFGFRGHIGFHYYNEPTLEWNRITEIKNILKVFVPTQKFILWTNGTTLDQYADRLSEWDRAVITNYDGRDFSELKKSHVDLTIGNWGFDDRREEKKCPSAESCWRGYNELIFDYYGNAHLCCYDWRGRLPIGNAWTDNIADIVARYKQYRALAYGDGREMDAAAPVVCRECSGKQKFTFGNLS